MKTTSDESAARPVADLLALRQRGGLIQLAAQAFARGTWMFGHIPGLIHDIIVGRLWVEYEDEPGRLYHHDNFERFVTAEYPHGLGASVQLLEDFLRHDLATYNLFQKELRRKVGGDGSNQHTVAVRQGRPSEEVEEGLLRGMEPEHGQDGMVADAEGVMRDVGTVCIPGAKEALLAKKEYKRKGGNSREQALRRLEKDRPDLLREVLDEKLTCNAAMIQAGFRKKSITISAREAADPRRIAAKLAEACDRSTLVRVRSELGAYCEAG